MNYVIRVADDPDIKARRRQSARSALKAVHEMHRQGFSNLAIVDGEGVQISMDELAARAGRGRNA
jgi:hypothetical protein